MTSELAIHAFAKELHDALVGCLAETRPCDPDTGSKPKHHYATAEKLLGRGIAEAKKPRRFQVTTPRDIYAEIDRRASTESGALRRAALTEILEWLDEPVDEA